ncbi:hypothetical protein XAC301_37850 [Xanthomonas arboricola pv. corylina]|uniref:Transcriptional regulator n=1 Tax=Xanthomonas arboricola pv. corylina TaxID=487821 RepID=A0ABN7N0V7_9XANT|nr:hypothetical protein XAC301_37850 [Xanthomonas arboricola pv. corylina]CAE6838038.1 hypothetical protein XAC301_37850 [Xanthomonas arboricola pv. corylina]
MSTSPKPSGSSPANWRALRGSLWLDYCLSRSGVTPYRFAVDYMADDNADSRLVSKWLSGKASPTRASALRVAGLPDRRRREPAKSLPNSIWLFDAASLLGPEAPTRKRVTALIDERLSKVGASSWRWNFPDEDVPLSYASTRYDVVELEARADIWGLLALVCLMWEAELLHLGTIHAELFKAANRMVANTIKPPWALTYQAAISSLIPEFRGRVLLTYLLLDSSGSERQVGSLGP